MRAPEKERANIMCAKQKQCIRIMGGRKCLSREGCGNVENPEEDEEDLPKGRGYENTYVILLSYNPT